MKKAILVWFCITGLVVAGCSLSDDNAVRHLNQVAEQDEHHIMTGEGLMPMTLMSGGVSIAIHGPNYTKVGEPVTFEAVMWGEDADSVAWTINDNPVASAPPGYSLTWAPGPSLENTQAIVTATGYWGLHTQASTTHQIVIGAGLIPQLEYNIIGSTATFRVPKLYEGNVRCWAFFPNTDLNDNWWRIVGGTPLCPEDGDPGDDFVTVQGTDWGELVIHAYAYDFNSGPPDYEDFPATTLTAIKKWGKIYDTWLGWPDKDGQMNYGSGQTRIVWNEDENRWEGRATLCDLVIGRFLTDGGFEYSKLADGADVQWWVMDANSPVHELPSDVPASELVPLVNQMQAAYPSQQVGFGECGVKHISTSTESGRVCLDLVSCGEEVVNIVVVAKYPDQLQYQQWPVFPQILNWDFWGEQVDTHAPIARASDISGQATVMHPDEPYTVTAKYFDPDGREDLKYSYLQLRHPSKDLTMMWYQANGHATPWAGEEGEDYLEIVSVDATPITEGGLEGYELAWTFTINDQWPAVENAIDFGVQAWDDSDLKSGWDYDHTKATFMHEEDPENQPPVALAESMSVRPRTMFPGIQYTVAAAYHDPDGMEDLQYCYLRLNHPTKPLTLRWEQATDEYSVDEGADYVTVTGHTVPMHPTGYDLNWQFTIDDAWPEVKNSINFGVSAMDQQGAVSGWGYDDKEASFFRSIALEVTIRDTETEAELDSAWVGEEFSIHVTAPQGWPVDVRFSVDDAQDGVPTGMWTDWYRWDDLDVTSWNEDTRIKARAFATGGPKEVWAQVRFGGGVSTRVPITAFADFAFAHMTDTHMEYHLRPFKSVDPRAEYWLAAALEKMKTHGNKGPQIVLVTGDIVEAAYLKSKWDPFPECHDVPYFQTFSDVVDKFSAIPVYTVPGNHDRYCITRLIYAPYDTNAGLDLYNDVLGDRRPHNAETVYTTDCGHADYAFRYGGLQFIGLDSGRTVFGTKRWEFIHADGSGLTDQQLAALRALREDIPKVVFMHHPLWNDDPKSRGVITANQAEFRDFTLDYNVQLVIAGHTHTDWEYSDRPAKENVKHVITPATVGDGAGYRLIYVTQNKDGSIRVDPQPVTPIRREDTRGITLDLGSPVELEVYDSEGRRTHITKGGVIADEIPYVIHVPSPYSPQDQEEDTPLGSVLLFDISEGYEYVVHGIDTGTYSMSVELWDGSEESTWFLGKGIPCTEGSVHRYTIDWCALASGEEGVTIEMDDDGDGIVDRTLTTGSMLASVGTATETDTAFFKASDGVIDNLEALPVPPGAPAGVVFPHGLFSFNITELDYDGQTVTITIDLPTPVPPGTKWWKYHDGQWHDYNIPITIDGNTITITLTDGGVGDIDGIADGIITDPGGPGYPRLPPTAGSAYPMWSVFLAAVMAGASLLLLRRRRRGQESA